MSYRVVLVRTDSAEAAFEGEELQEARAFADEFNQREAVHPTGWMAVIDDRLLVHQKCTHAN